jgi:hypothetical protein
MSSLAAGETMLIVAQLDDVLIQTVITSTTALAVMREGNAGLAAWWPDQAVGLGWSGILSALQGFGAGPRSLAERPKWLVRMTSAQLAMLWAPLIAASSDCRAMIGRKAWLFAGADTGAETLARHDCYRNGQAKRPRPAGLPRWHSRPHTRPQDQPTGWVAAVDLDAAELCQFRGRMMTAVTQLCTIGYVAKMLGKDVALLEAIISNDDN